MGKHRPIEAALSRHYAAAAAAYGISREAVLCHDEQRHFRRFANLTSGMDLANAATSILDVGCGNGEFVRFLNFMGFRGEYLGTDITQDLVAQAQIKFPAYQFVCADLTQNTDLARYQYVIASGLFNIDVGQSVSWVHEVLESMWNHTIYQLRVDALSSFVNFTDEGFFYLDPLDLTAWAIGHLSPQVVLNHHALPYNFTLFVDRSPDWTSTKSRAHGST